MVDMKYMMLVKEKIKMGVQNFKYVSEIRDKRDYILGYILEDINGNLYRYKSEDVKAAIRSGQLKVEGLELTVDNRLIKKKINTVGNVGNSPFIVPRELIKRINSKGKILMFKATDTESLKKYAKNYRAKIKVNSFNQPYTVAKNSSYVCVIGVGTHIELPVDSSYMFDKTDFDIINLSGVYANRVENMDNMFRSSKSKIIFPETFVTSNVKSMIGTFSYYQSDCLDISMLDTSGVKNMSRMFDGAGIHHLDLSRMNTGNVVCMDSMFERVMIDNLIMPLYMSTKSLVSISSMFEEAVIIKMVFQNFYLDHMVRHADLLKNNHIHDAENQLPPAIKDIAHGIIAKHK